MMKTDAAELARVGENERAFPLKQNEVVVFGRPVIRRFDADLAGHAEMNEKEVIAGELEEHPFPARMRGEKFFTNQPSAELLHILATKDAVPRMQAKIDNLRAAAGVPLFAKPFDLSQ